MRKKTVTVRFDVDDEMEIGPDHPGPFILPETFKDYLTEELGLPHDEEYNAGDSFFIRDLEVLAIEDAP